MARICDQVVPHSQVKEGQEVCLCFQPTDGPAADFRALPLVDDHLKGFRDLLRRSLMPCGWHCKVSSTRNGASLHTYRSSELREAVSTSFVGVVHPPADELNTIRSRACLYLLSVRSYRHKTHHTSGTKNENFQVKFRFARIYYFLNNFWCFHNERDPNHKKLL